MAVLGLCTVVLDFARPFQWLFILVQVCCLSVMAMLEFYTAVLKESTVNLFFLPARLWWTQHASPGLSMPMFDLCIARASTLAWSCWLSARPNQYDPPNALFVPNCRGFVLLMLWRLLCLGCGCWCHFCSIKGIMLITCIIYYQFKAQYDLNFHRWDDKIAAYHNSHKSECTNPHSQEESSTTPMPKINYVCILGRTDLGKDDEFWSAAYNLGVTLVAQKLHLMYEGGVKGL